MTEPELDGMPDPQAQQRIEYSFKRNEFVDEADRLDVGDVVKDPAPGWFRIDRVTHTKDGRNDVYTLKAVEIE